MNNSETNVAMEQFWEDLDAGEVHIRDKWQFALKSDYFLHTGQPHSYVQEFYLFIPNSLQINKNTYSKEQFYQDETNLIRFKTPEFSFSELLDRHDQRSPLTQIFFLLDLEDTEEHRKLLSDELKLLANVVRSTLRREVKSLLLMLDRQKLDDTLIKKFLACTNALRNQIDQLRNDYKEAQVKYSVTWEDPAFYREFLYIDEFIGNVISHYIAGLLESIRMLKQEGLLEVDRHLSEILLREQSLKDLLPSLQNHKKGRIDTLEGEQVIYRFGMLNKFIMDALHLKTNRFSLDQQYQHWIGSLSAGIAMLLYFSLFVIMGGVFVINSAPFILLTVIIYVLKDRIKEWLKTLSYQQASRWFPDYTTIIKSPDENKNLGVLKESFSLIDPPQLSQELKDVRNLEFNTVLETFQRPESVLFYKRIVDINSIYSDRRRYGLNIIFRFNVHRFLRKASDPYEAHSVLDPTTNKLNIIRLPKVYHLNLIIRSVIVQNDKVSRVELKNLRIVIDKNGIKRIEQLSRR